MKTLKSLFLLSFCFFAFQISAQFSIGIKAGYVKAWEEYGDVDLPEDAQIHVHGFQLSTQAYYQFNERFRLGAEPGYTQRGAACVPGWNVGISPIFEGDTKLLLNYVELPLMAAVRFPVFKDKLEIFGKAGYGLSMLTKAYEVVTPLEGNESPRKTEIDITNPNRIKRFDHGIYSGLGLGLNLGKNQLFVESNYYFGVKDVDPWNTSRNRSLQLALGYSIRL